MSTVRQALDIMGEFYDRYNSDPDWVPWFLINDITIPLSWLCFRGIATPTDEAIPYINETWKSFCETHGIDEYNNFESLDEFEEFVNSVN